MYFVTTEQNSADMMPSRRVPGRFHPRVRVTHLQEKKTNKKKDSKRRQTKTEETNSPEVDMMP
jgi:hypothetical protein